MSPVSLLLAVLLPCAAAESHYSQHVSLATSGTQAKGVSLATSGTQAVSSSLVKVIRNRGATMAELLDGSDKGATMADLLRGAAASHSPLALAEQHGPVKVPEQGYTGK